MKKVVLLMAVMALFVLGVKAQQPAKVPAYKGVIERVQPNGDTLQIYLRGDERMHFSMTLDGWQIKENESGYICYAQQKRDGSIIASKKVAHNEADRTKCEKRWLKRKGIKKVVA